MDGQLKPDLTSPLPAAVLCELPEGHLGSFVIALKQKQNQNRDRMVLAVSQSGSFKLFLPFLDFGVVVHPICVHLNSHPDQYTIHRPS